MKKLKWDAINVSKETKIAAFASEHSLDRSRSRMIWLAREFQESYDEWTGDAPASTLALEVLDFGGLLLKFGVHPSLIAMNVPFHVRRQIYENYAELGDIIHHSLNSDDRYFNDWTSKQVSRGRDTVSKTSLARALWAWYYGVFEPVAKRFVVLGAEHMSSNNK
jgi:hypothetical protein